MGGRLGLGLLGVRGLDIVVWCSHSFVHAYQCYRGREGGREDPVLSCLKKDY